MAEQNPNPSLESVARGYEHGEPRIGWFVTAVVGFVLLGAIIFGGVGYLMKTSAHARRLDRRTSAVMGYASAGQATPTPPLQPSPQHDQTAAQDLETMRHDEDQIFLALGWRVDAVNHRANPPDALVRRVAQRFQTHPTTQGGAK